MKIGIVTFQQTNNYGGILQNYALQKAIHSLDHDVETIDYHSKYISKPYKLAHLKNKGLYTYLFGLAGYLCYIPRTKMCRSFRDLIQYSPPVNVDTIQKLNEQYDIFITGSDQVWNYALTGMDTTYLLDFVQEKNKCNSYAASLGLKEIAEDKKCEYKKHLEKYRCITVREQGAADILQDILDREVLLAIDPCLLLSRAEWETVMPRMKMPSKYVLVYQLGVSADIVMLAKKIAKEQGMKIVFVPFPIGRPIKGSWKIGAGPGELIRYIRDAEYVVTDSFHGTIFSILFQKKFVTKISGTHAGVGSRIRDLLTRYGLQDRIMHANIQYQNDIDYEHTNNLLEQDRQYSQGLLKQICSNK